MGFSPGGGGSSQSIGASTDAAMSNITQNQALVYDGGTGKWQNQTFAGTSGTALPGTVFFDSYFAGSTDSAKFTALNAWAQVQSGPTKSVLFAARQYNFNVPIKLFSGLKLLGGTQSAPRGYGRSTIFNWQGGSGTSMFIYPSEGQTGQSYPSDGSPRDITISYIQMQGVSSTHCMEKISPTGSNYVGHTLWYCQFHSCSFKGFATVWWGYGTGSSISGQTHFEAIADTAINMGGSENSIFGRDTTSVAYNATTTSVPFMRSTMSKSFIGRCKITCRKAEVALVIESGHNIVVDGLIIDADANDPVYGAGLRISGGDGIVITNCSFKGVASNPASGNGGSSLNNGWIHVSGGNQITVQGNSFRREGSNLPAVEYPLLFVASSVAASAVRWGYNNYSNFGASTVLVLEEAVGKIILATDPRVTTDPNSGGGTPTDPEHADRIGVIGDSLTAMNTNGVGWVTAELIDHGWESTNIRVDGVIGRGITTPGAVPTNPPYTPDVIDTWRADGFDPRVWLFALGTNNQNDTSAYWASSIQSIIDKVMSGPANDYVIYWIGTGYKNSSTDHNSVQFQEKLDEFSENNSNFTACDYNVYLSQYRSHPSWDSWWTANADGIHNTNSGYQALRVPFYGLSVASEAPLPGGSTTAPIALTGTGNAVAGSANSGTTITINKPANTTNGDLLVAVVWARFSGGVDYTTPPSGWSIMPASNPGSSVGVIRTYYKAISGSEPAANYTWAGGGSGRHTGVIFRVTGASNTDPFDSNGAYATAISDGNNMLLTLPNNVTQNSNTLVLALLGCNTTSGSQTAYTLNGGFTEIGRASTNTGASESTLQVAGQAMLVAGNTGSKTFYAAAPMPPSSSGAGYILAIKSI